LIQQLTLGLDYYAQPINQVPLISVEYYRTIVAELLKYASDIELSYLAYKDAQRLQEDRISAFSEVKNRALLSIGRLQSLKPEIVAEQANLNQAIDRLGNALNDLWVQLMTAELDFQNAIASRGKGCDFQQMMAIGASLATLIASGGTAAPAIGLALAAIQKKQLKYDDGKLVGDDFNDFKFKVNTVVTAGKDINSFADAFRKVQDAIKPRPIPGSNIPGLPSDEAKIVASADAIEAQLKDFMDLPEAQEYRKLIRAFVSTSEARNNKILEYNNLILRWDKTEADITQLQLEAAAAQSRIASTKNPFILEAVNFMTKSLDRC
jgi:hypothetical protein